MTPEEQYHYIAKANLRPGWDLDQEEHAEATKMINELQDRIVTLHLRKDSVTKTKGLFNQPDIYTVRAGDNDIILIRQGNSWMDVSVGGKHILQITGTNLDTINLQGMKEALTIIRRIMILDDLANV